MSGLSKDQGLAKGPNLWDIKEQRVKYAELSFRQNNKDWQRLEDSYQPCDPKYKMFAPWNVEQMSIRGSSIKINQYGDRYNRNNRAPGGRVLTEDEHCWRVNFRHLTSIHLCEFDTGSDEVKKRIEASGDTYNPKWFIEIRFKCNDLRSFDATEPKVVPPNPGLDTQVANPTVSEDDAPLAPLAPPPLPALPRTSGASHQGPEVYTEMEQATNILEVDPVPNSPAQGFPLATLLEKDTAANDLDFKTVFRKAGTKPSDSFSWSWPATITLLAGREKWVVATKIEETRVRNGLPLPEYLGRYGTPPAATTKQLVTKSGGLGYHLKPKP